MLVKIVIVMPNSSQMLEEDVWRLVQKKGCGGSMRKELGRRGGAEVSAQ